MRYSVLIIVLFFLSPFLYAKENLSFYGKVVKDKINVRVDSTILSKVIGKVNKGNILQVVDEKYDWYKIILPSYFSCYVYKKYFKKIKDNIYKCVASQVNIRLSPSLDSYVLGMLDKGMEVKVKAIKGDFFEIDAPPKAYGWIHKKFLVKIEKSQIPQTNFSVEHSSLPKKEKFVNTQDTGFRIEKTLGEEKYAIIQGYLIKEKGRYKISSEDKIFILKTNKNLDKFVGKVVIIEGVYKKIGNKKKFVIKKLSIKS